MCATFAIMALLNGVLGGGPAEMLCALCRRPGLG